MNRFKTILAVLTNQLGQDLIEYSLLLAFVCLASAGLFLNTGNSGKGIWTTTSSRLSAATLAAGGSPQRPGGGGNPSGGGNGGGNGNGGGGNGHGSPGR